METVESTKMEAVERSKAAAPSVIKTAAGAGNKAAAGAEDKAAAGAEDKAAAGAGNKAAAIKPKMRMVKVGQQFINALLADEPKREARRRRFLDNDEGILSAMAEVMDPEKLEDTRAAFARCAANFQAAYDMDTDILKQYREKGYAIIEVEDYD